MVPLHQPRPDQPQINTAWKPALELVAGGLAAESVSSRRLPFLLPCLRGLIKTLPAGLPMWIYTTLLKPAPLRRMVNALLLKAIPEQVQVNGVTVVLNPTDPVVSSALRWAFTRRYETQLITELVQPGMRFWT